MIDGDVPSANLTEIVEPWFLGAGMDSPPGQEFVAWKNEVEPKGVSFYDSVDALPMTTEKKLALISGRTADNPRLLQEVIAKGCTHIFLEKPGAPTVGELEEMAAFAAAKNVAVFMGYNKNVTKYVTLAREFEAQTPGASTTFIHNNAYKEEELPECFERNSEGMLKNMAVHELALLVTYYGVAADTIQDIKADKEFSRVLTLNGYTDFASVGFTITTTAGKTVTVKANRTGGSFSEAVVHVDGVEKFKSMTPDEELEKIVAVKQAENPDYMPYFFLQHDDYITLKERCCKHIVEGKPGAPEGIATIDIAIETLKVAEMLTPKLQEQLA
eukprot:scaffold735_cov255-Pinguiococcus_pyrenoidosus.AAC.26